MKYMIDEPAPRGRGVVQIAATAANALLGSVLVLLGAALAATITFTAVDIAPETWSSLGASLTSALGEDLASLLATFQIDLGTLHIGPDEVDLLDAVLGGPRVERTHRHGDRARKGAPRVFGQVQTRRTDRARCVPTLVEGDVLARWNTRRLVELGRAVVQRTFAISRIGVIAGCRVISGIIARNGRLRVIRDNRVLGDYGIESLKREKDDAREVRDGLECGIKVANFNDVKEGDVLECYRIEEVARMLGGLEITATTRKHAKEMLAA